VERFDMASAYLPRRLRRWAAMLSAEKKAAAEELRLRAGRMASIVIDGEEISLGPLGEIVTPVELEELCALACEHSRYASHTLKNGYITLRGGFRAGFCGTAVVKNGEITNLKDISSASIRISRERRRVAEEAVRLLASGGSLPSTLILSPPGVGKTTFLRDAVRLVSNGDAGVLPLRVALMDERGEIAVMHGGAPQMDVGERTDVLDGCPKAEGIFMALRAMNPQLIAVDEITAAEDIRAMTMAANCGVSLLATIHAKDKAELLRKPLYTELLRAGVFTHAVRIDRLGKGRRYRVEELP